MIGDFLSIAYPWIKSLHVISVISWMAGIFYLTSIVCPSHRIRKDWVQRQTLLFQKMESKLLKIIMGPAMGATWLFGILLAMTPGSY